MLPNAFPASAAEFIASTLIPSTSLENSIIDFPKGTNCSPNFPKDDSPEKKEAKLSMKLLAVNAKIATANDLIPSLTEGSISLAPFKNGCKACINDDKFSPTDTNPLETPDKKPPAIFPTNSPIAVPIFASILDPSPISQSKPSICASPPKAANIAAIPATTMANATIPFNAPATGIVLTIFAVIPNATNIPATDSRDESKLAKPPFPKASPKALKNLPIKFIAESTSSGILSARLSIMLIRKLNIPSTI